MMPVAPSYSLHRSQEQQLEWPNLAFYTGKLDGRFWCWYRVSSAQRANIVLGVQSSTLFLFLYYTHEYTILEFILSVSRASSYSTFFFCNRSVSIFKQILSKTKTGLFTCLMVRKHKSSRSPKPVKLFQKSWKKILNFTPHFTICLRTLPAKKQLIKWKQLASCLLMLYISYYWLQEF